MPAIWKSAKSTAARPPPRSVWPASTRRRTEATGSSILSLFGGLPLSVLNNGTGVRFDNSLSDLKINFQDGTSTTVDFSSVPTPGTQARGTTLAANGANAALTFTAVNAGSQYARRLPSSFQNSPSITAGNETVNYDATTKQLTFNIAAGQTTANDIINALKNNSTASALFTASDCQRRQWHRHRHQFRRRVSDRPPIDRHHARHTFVERQDSVYGRRRGAPTTTTSRSNSSTIRRLPPGRKQSPTTTATPTINSSSSRLPPARPRPATSSTR